ncbi:MAG TPA: carboxylating nicotinate-nucleotide diphosphorylase [Bacteroidia bacterium]
MKPKNKPAYITRPFLERFISNALKEDIGDGDHTSLACVPARAKGRARLLVKDPGIIAGVELAQLIFKKVDRALNVKVLIADGKRVEPGDVVLTVSGNDRSILTAERLVLNCMQRMSGIATLTNRIVDHCKDAKTKVLDTRKTTPGMRLIEKWAVKIGGGENHRIGLYDMILIKDNHVDYCGGIRNAIEAANVYLKKKKKKLKIEIEVRNMKELQEVLQTGKVDRILLDNMSPLEMKNAVEIVKGRFETEASGGITEVNVHEYALSGVNYISIGALTHSYRSLDLSLKAF